MPSRGMTRTERFQALLATLGILLGLLLVAVVSHLGGVLLGVGAALLGAMICIPSLGLLIVALTGYPHTHRLSAYALMAR